MQSRGFGRRLQGFQIRSGRGTRAVWLVGLWRSSACLGAMSSPYCIRIEVAWLYHSANGWCSWTFPLNWNVIQIGPLL